MWAPPGSQVGVRPPSPRRTERARCPALRSRLTNALSRARRVRFAVWGLGDLPVTVGMAERSRHPPVMRVVALPVMPFERLLTRDHLWADETPPVVRSQDLGPKSRRRMPGQWAGTALKGRLPCRVEGGGVPVDLDVALRFDHLPNADAPFPGGWIGEPPGGPRLMGNVARSDPVPGVVRVAPLGPPLEPSPDDVVAGGACLATEDMAVIVRPPPQPGGQGRDARGRGGSRGWLTASVDPRLEGLEADRAGRHLERAQLAVGSRRGASRLPEAVDARCAGRDDGLRR
jgi:hypothetical protein